MNYMGSRITGIVLITGGLLLSGGCGYKNHPLPPDEVVPKAITDLSYTLTDKGARLQWSYPVETKVGEDITDHVSFEVYRAEIPQKNYCPTCPIPFDEPVEHPGGAIFTADGTKRQVAEYTSGLLQAGNHYFFKVKSRTSWLAASDDSNIIAFLYHAAAAAPNNIKLTDKEDRVELSWAPVKFYTDGKPVDTTVLYQVEKSEDGKSWKAAGGSDQAAQFIDKKVEVGKTYFYRVKSSTLVDGVAVAGSISESNSVTIADVSPPAVVEGVTVVVSASNVRIFWNGVEDKDLAGYKIYRRVGKGSKVVKIGEVGPTTTLFVDNELIENSKVYYSVSSFDKGGKESKRSKEATTRH